jgi:hypothetical protein
VALTISKPLRDNYVGVPRNRGPVAQLGARFHGMEEVVGSIPTRSTNSRFRSRSQFRDSSVSSKLRRSTSR